MEINGKGGGDSNEYGTAVGYLICPDIWLIQPTRHQSSDALDNHGNCTDCHRVIRTLIDVERRSKIMKLRNVLLVSIAVLALLLTGCKQDTTIEVRYVSELSPGALDSLRAQSEGVDITVAQFVDSRDTIGIAGAKNPIGNVAISYNSRKSVSELVRDTLADVLRDNGFVVDTMGLWTLQPETIEHVATSLAMGGDIKVFWAENRPNPGTYSTGGTGFSNVRILFVLADPSSGETIWQGQIEGGVTRSAIFSTPKLEEMLEVSFSQVMDKLLTNNDFIRALGRF